eukprot:6381406-Ditylum_brightwellii.AAC.1
MTTEGMRHIKMCKNAIQESVQKNFATIQHIGGKINPSDIFTKEDHNVQHFFTIREHLMSRPLSQETVTAQKSRVIVSVE